MGEIEANGTSEFGDEYLGELLYEFEPSVRRNFPRAKCCFLFAVSLSGSVVVAWVVGCSSASRSSVPPDAGSDGDSDTDTTTETETQSDTWDTDEPGLNVLSTTRILSLPQIYHSGVHSLGAVADTATIGVAVSYSIEDLDIEGDGFHFLSFPWEDPSSPSQGFYDPSSPACPEYYGGGEVKPYAVDGGFLSLASVAFPPSESDGLCQMTTSDWDASADLVGDPHGIEGIYETETGSRPFPPDGEQDETGAVIVGRFIIEGDAYGTYGNRMAFVQADRFGPGGTHETALAPVEYPWIDLWDVTGETVAARNQRTFVREGLVSIIAPTVVEGPLPPWVEDQSLVFVQGALDGEVTVPPRVSHVPPDKDGYPVNHGGHAFAAREDEILAAPQVVYEDGAGGCVTDRYTVRIDFEGEQIAEPTLLESAPWCACQVGERHCGDASLEWSGLYYGYCDLEETYGEVASEGVTYSFWLLDAEGALVAGPIAIFDTVSTPESAVTEMLAGYKCEVVPLADDTFAAVFSTPSYVPEPTDGPGVWIAYLKYVPAE